LLFFLPKTINKTTNVSEILFLLAFLKIYIYNCYKLIALEIIYTEKNLNTIAKNIIENINSKILFIYGPMGAGKTTLTKALVNAIGGNKDDVSSPTFSIVNEYVAGSETIYHFDLYRIKNIEEAYNFGIEEYLYSNNWIIVEWPQTIEELMTDNYNRIDIKINNDNSRTLNLKSI